jgi:hypothetical protein
MLTTAYKCRKQALNLGLKISSIASMEFSAACQIQIAIDSVRATFVMVPLQHQTRFLAQQIEEKEGTQNDRTAGLSNPF